MNQLEHQRWKHNRILFPTLRMVHNGACFHRILSFFFDMSNCVELEGTGCCGLSKRVELTSLWSFLALVRETVEACDYEVCSPLLIGPASLNSDLTFWDGFASR